MKETLELRMTDTMASRLVGDDVGRRIGHRGWVRVLRLRTEDPLVARLVAADRAAKDRGESIFTSWNIERSYSPSELSRADLLQIWSTAMFEPAGEECGTEYTYSAQCPRCGAGRVLKSELILDTSKIPRNADVALTIARDEIVVSERVAELVDTYRLTGAVLRPVRDIRGHAAAWFQLGFDSMPVVAVEPSRFGDNPLSGSSTTACAPGHVAGLNLLSELYIDRKSWDGSDFARTREPVGVRMGLLAPHSLILVSQRVRQVLQDGGCRGFKVEVAHLVDDSGG